MTGRTAWHSKGDDEMNAKDTMINRTIEGLTMAASVNRTIDERQTTVRTIGI